MKRHMMKFCWLMRALATIAIVDSWIGLIGTDDPSLAGFYLVSQLVWLYLFAWWWSDKREAEAR